MNNPLDIPTGLRFLALGEESLPLLKRGVIPLQAPTDTGLPWFSTSAQTPAPTLRISDDDYHQHLQQEYARLPASLQGLLTLEAFIRQAEAKRADIEAALLSQRRLQVDQATGKAADWLVQRFFSNPFSLLNWQQRGGLNTVWLGIDPRQWEDVCLQEVSYRQRQPAAFPQRLLADAADMAVLEEWRLVQPVSAFERLIEIGGRPQGLLRLPPKALRCVLLGAALRPAFVQTFSAFWRQDFRYQRTPLAHMILSADDYGWRFQALR